MHSSRMQQSRDENRAAALRFLGKGLSTSQCRPPSEQRWQLLCNSVSRRQCVNQKDASDDQNLIRLWRCSNLDQQWELCQNLGCIWVPLGLGLGYEHTFLSRYHTVIYSNLQ